MMTPRLPRPTTASLVTGLRACLGALAVLAVAQLAVTVSAHASSRIKDVTTVEGVRDNVLVGYGIVVGLQGTGDSMDNSPYTERSLTGLLERMGVNVHNEELGSQNVAAVMVTGDLPPFVGQGNEFDVNISAMGDASSLEGGRLLPTPLVGADGETYAVASGTIQVSGFALEGQAEEVVRGVPTGGRIPNGATVEREVDFSLDELAEVDLTLSNPDFTTAQRIADAINTFHDGESPIADATDPGTVVVDVPRPRRDDVAGLMQEIEQLRVEPDQPARVVIDEDSGTVVMGQNVRISTVAIAQGNLTIRITETPQVAMPGPFAPAADPTVVPRTEIEIDEEEAELAVMDGGVTLQDLVDGLNALGLNPRDLITILQAVKAAGALQAELEVM